MSLASAQGWQGWVPLEQEEMEECMDAEWVQPMEVAHSLAARVEISEAKDTRELNFLVVHKQALVATDIPMKVVLEVRGNPSNRLKVILVGLCYSEDVVPQG